jgi:two-component system, sporulation sensor kinase B
MKQLIMHLLINILFMMVSVLLYYSFWFRQEKKLSKFKGHFHVAFCLITTILCIIFSTPIEYGIRLNLQHIMILVTIFFVGKKSGGILFISMNVIHLFIGGNDLIASIVATTIVYTLSMIVYDYFQRISVIRQVMMSVFITFSAVFVCLSLFLDSEVSYYYRYELAIFYVFQLVGTALIMYLVNVLKLQDAFREQLINVEKSQLISDMAASIAHEIRNPLTTTKGFLQLLQEKDISHDKQQMYTNVALEGISQANAVITNYLTFAKPKIEKIERLHLQQELGKAINLLTPLANMTNVSIQFDPSDQDMYIHGEKQKLHQCLLNLLKNSIEAMPCGGELIVQITKQQTHAYVYISDNGVGMTDEQVKQLGAPFYSTKEKGTGLGMMVVFSILKAMQAEIQIESEKNKGTTFTIMFPLK